MYELDIPYFKTFSDAINPYTYYIFRGMYECLNFFYYYIYILEERDRDRELKYNIG